MDNNTFTIEKKWLRQAFDHAAHHYDDVAVLQQTIGQRILERLQLIRSQPAIIVDIGAGTGQLTRQLARRYRHSRIIALDLAPAMLQQGRRQLTWWQRRQGRQTFVCGDAESLPFSDNSVDMICSNVTLQWCNSLDQAFAEFKRILRPNGLLMFSTFGPDTLKELRQSWAEVDHYNHVNAFIDMHDIGDALLRSGMSDPVMDMEPFTVTYRDIGTLLRELKTLGAHNVTAGRPRGLTGRQRLQQLYAAYERFRTRDGLLPVHYEVIYGHAWVDDAAARQNVQHHDIHVPLTQLQRPAT